MERETEKFSKEGATYSLAHSKDCGMENGAAVIEVDNEKFLSYYGSNNPKYAEHFENFCRFNGTNPVFYKAPLEACADMSADKARHCTGIGEKKNFTQAEARYLLANSMNFSVASHQDGALIEVVSDDFAKIMGVPNNSTAEYYNGFSRYHYSSSQNNPVFYREALEYCAGMDLADARKQFVINEAYTKCDNREHYGKVVALDTGSSKSHGS